ncbi:CMRF35-like molecule 1 [Micropterus dolomieu]|uniref:CMRF35-like molecule 1 n=1 Tax=Micropterus dolomieu TaxID=147949 RepID=UPI001E8E860C|nr:CMRF35-like molecule 1 [Micropterus dolomieu]
MSSHFTSTCFSSLCHLQSLSSSQNHRRAESGRITLVDSGDGFFTVTFRQLQLSDSGIYWCGVDRPVFDTFTSVNLTVKEAVATVTPELSFTWTYGNFSTSTELTSGMNTSSPTNLSTASNYTNVREQNISTDTVLYASVGGAAVLTILVLAMCFRKCREISKPQPQVCSNSTDLISAAEREVCGRNWSMSPHNNCLLRET